MGATWLSIRVELVSGRGEWFWPRPGRDFAVPRRTTFREFADAVNVAFARWELSHLHSFTLADGTLLVSYDRWGDWPEGAQDDTCTMSRLQAGEQFAYEFDMGDGWEHVCTVGPKRIDPLAVLGHVAPGPEPYFGWGTLPDQHGRRWDDDPVWEEAAVPEQPDPPGSDLPPLQPTWGPPGAFRALRGGGQDLGPLSTLLLDPDLAPMEDWDLDAVATLRGALARRDGATALALCRTRWPVEVAQLSGPGLVLAIAQDHEDALQLLIGLIDDLRGRVDEGAIELSLQLEAAAGQLLDPVAVRQLLGDDLAVDDEPPTRTVVPVGLDELSTHLEGDGFGDGTGWRLSVTTGQIWSDDPMGDSGIEPPEDWDDDGAWLEIRPLGGRAGWQDMSDFAGDLEDGELGERLLDAIDGKGAFGRFRRILDDEDEARDAWRVFKEQRQLGRARAWLDRHGYRPAMPGVDDVPE